jgi:hypothetical protein
MSRMKDIFRDLAAGVEALEAKLSILWREYFTDLSGIYHPLTGGG